MQQHVPHVIIIGGGFGGLQAARAMRKDPVRITLIDRNNHHLFQPLLYQVATAGMTAEEIAVPIRSVLGKQRNCNVLLAEVEGVDPISKTVRLKRGAPMTYDYLIIAAGAQTNYFGHNEWEQTSFGLKRIEDAFSVRHRILLNFEQAEQQEDPERRRQLLTFVVIGGGPTGVELAGALSELTKIVLAKDFRRLKPDDIQVILLEAAPRLLISFHEKLSQNAKKELESLGVQVRLATNVTQIDADAVQMGNERLPAGLVCWTAGVKPQPLSQAIDGVQANARGHIPVTSDCSIEHHPHTFVIGDMASFVPSPGARPLPGVAPVAMQQARHVARMIRATLKNKPRKPFIYQDKGSMATIGKSRAVLEFGALRMTGFLAWMAWIVVHVFYLIGFRNRALVMFDWFWSYVSNHRGARLLIRPPEHLPQNKK